MILDPKLDIFAGTGRRKQASARVRLAKGDGKIVVNGKPVKEYRPEEQFLKAVNGPLIIVELLDQLDISVKVEGGGPVGQAGAVSLGIARALEKMDGEFRKPLKKAGFLRRDPRKKERKKPGQPGARKKFQFSKR